MVGMYVLASLILQSDLAVDGAMLGTSDAVNVVVSPMTEEFDAVVTDWKQGKELGLKHRLFQLDSVSGGGVDGTIQFADEKGLYR